MPLSLLFSFLLITTATATERTNENDYGRAVLGGSQGGIGWQSLLHGDDLQGWSAEGDPWHPTAWSREGNTIYANVNKGRRARLTQGDSTWVSYEIKVQATVFAGGLQIWIALAGGHGAPYHLATLAGWKAMALIDKHHTKLDVVNFIIEPGTEYDIVLAVRGNSVTSYVDGQLVNRLTVSAPLRGGIGLAVWGHGQVAFRDPKIRHYYQAH